MLKFHFFDKFGTCLVAATRGVLKNVVPSMNELLFRIATDQEHISKKDKILIQWEHFFQEQLFESALLPWW